VSASVRPFEFSLGTRIVFGRGRFERIGTLGAELGRAALVVTNADREGKQGLQERLDSLAGASGLALATLWIEGEPEIEDVDRGVELARQAGCDLVIGLGGGSAIDAAKAVAGLLANGGACLDYMEVIGRGLPIRKAAVPWIAAPTTAGTGAEVTRNAVIGSRARAYKASIRSPLLLPRVALVDPELCVGLPRDVTARTGIDALTQCIESYTSNGAGPLTDALALRGVELAGRWLRRACERGHDLDAREAMSLTALISGITLSHAGLGAVHGIAAPAGARFPAPHGAVCAALLPRVMRANIDEARKADPRHPVLERYATIGRALAGDAALGAEEAVEAGAARAADLARDLGIPGLAAFGLAEEAIPGIVEMALRASSMKYNPVRLSPETLAEVLRRAL
jgi:alcohol dehydrogenase class IV